VALALAVPIAVYAWSLAAMHALAEGDAREARAGGVVGLAAVGVALVVPPMGMTVLGLGLLLTVAVAQHVWAGQRRLSGETPGAWAAAP
jgi:hypothetical protein